MQPSASTPPLHREPLFTRQFWTACSMHFTGAMALSLYILFPLFIRSLGGSEFTIGLYAGLTGASAVAARLPVGRLLDTQGRSRVLTAAGMLHVAAWCGFLTIGSLGIRSAMLVVVYGLASGSLFASYFTYASDIVPITRRAEGIAMFGIWGMLPNGLGPFLGEFLIAHGSFHMFFLVGAGFALTSLCLTQLLPETTGVAHRVASRTARPVDGVLSRELVRLLGATLLFGAAINSLFTFLAPYAASRGRGSVGSFFLSYALAAVAVRVFTSRLPDRLGLRRVLIPSLLLYAVGVSLVTHVDTLPALILVGMLCGAGHGYAFPILNVLAVELVPTAYRGRAVSWLTAMFDLGNTIGNPVFGAVAEWAGYGMMFGLAAFGMLTGAVIMLRSPRGD
jgi:MFS family permease